MSKELDERHHYITLVKERDRLKEINRELVEAIEWICQTVHQAHHEDERETCRKHTCRAGRDNIAKAKAEMRGER